MNYNIYQSSTAQQDHKDDEGLKVVVFYDGVTGSPEVRPDFPPALGRVYVEEWTVMITL